MTTLLRSKCALAPDLLQLQRLPVLGAVTAFRAALPVRCEASGGYLSRSTSVAFAQTFVTQRVERNPVYPTDIPRTSRWHCGPPVLNAASSAVFLLVIIWLKDSLLISNLPKRLFNYLSTLQSRHILPEKESLQFALYNLVVSYDQGVRRLSAK